MTKRKKNSYTDAERRAITEEYFAASGSGSAYRRGSQARRLGITPQALAGNAIRWRNSGILEPKPTNGATRPSPDECAQEDILTWLIAATSALGLEKGIVDGLISHRVLWERGVRTGQETP